MFETQYRKESRLLFALALMVTGASLTTWAIISLI